MSLETELTRDHKMSDDQEAPTYGEAFPPLPVAEGNGDVPPLWANPKVRPSVVTQVFSVPLEERRYNEMSDSQFGERGGQQAKICKDIADKTGVDIEMSLSKDQSLTVVLTGKADWVMKARKMVVQQLQTQARFTMKIPKEHHRFLLGQKGKNLEQIELATATKINVPRQEENSDIVTIVGTKEGIERARHELQTITDEQAKLASERIPVPKIYHPFICGPDNQYIHELMQKFHDIKINVPPFSVMKDEISVSGEKEGVQKVAQHIRKVYEEKKRKCRTVSVEVRKSQHKYVIGQRGSNLSEILAQTGVSVEVPPGESPSETITLRGEQEKLGTALTLVYTKANSIVLEEVKVPSWLHRHIIGRKGAKIRQLTHDFPKVHVEFTEGQDKIRVEGPPDDVQQAKTILEEITRDLESRMAFAEVQVDPKYHRHIIGRQGANIQRIKQETGVEIRIPQEEGGSNVIRIEGPKEGIEAARKELLDLASKMENERTKDIIIEQRFHRTIIGQKGAKIREIRDKFNQVQISFPEPGRKSDVVTLRGPRNDVDKCFKYLQQLHQELVASSYIAEVHIFKDFHRFIIGKGGSNIRKIRDETGTRIDLPSETSTSDIITITGKKENVEKAREKIEAIQKELANIKEIHIDIPHNLHNSIIGAKGRIVRAIMEECGGVIIRFPAENSTSDKVLIRGPKDDVENAKKQLLELASQKQETGHTAEIRVKPEYHRFLIGKRGASIVKLRESTGARIIFPAEEDIDQHTITIIGRKEAVEKAKAELEKRVINLENIVEMETTVPSKHHRHFIAHRAEVLGQLAEEYGGVMMSFPRIGMNSEKVTVKGAKECVEGAIKRIGEIVAELESYVTIECVVPQKHHRVVMGVRGQKIQDICREFGVNIKFPERAKANNNGGIGNSPDEEHEPVQNINGNSNGTEDDSAGDKTKSSDIIYITGKPDSCEAAKEAVLALVPITEEVIIAFELHRFIIGQKGAGARKFMEDYDVNLSIPPQLDKSDVVKVTGPRANVEKAKEYLKERVEELRKEQEEYEKRNFHLEVQVDPKHHPKIIGRKGAVITRIRQDHNVIIQLPDRNSDRQDVLTVIGYEKDTHAAEEEIKKLVSQLDQMITESITLDHRVHSRLIGAKGRSIRHTMDEYQVEIKFPGRDASDPDTVFVTGMEDRVFDCIDYLKNLEEEYMQDVRDNEILRSYQSPRREDSGNDHANSVQRGFVVRDAPWSPAQAGEGAGKVHVPDTTSMTDFPEFGLSSAPPSRGSSRWGPKH